VNPYYQDDHVTLCHGDCLDVLPAISEVDLIVTSPPYNLGSAPWDHVGHWKPGGKSAGGKGKWANGIDSAAGAQYNEHRDDMPHVEYVQWQRDVLAAAWNTLTDSGAIFYNHKPRVVGTSLWTPQELNPGLPLRQIVVWARAGGMNFKQTAYVPTHEWIMVFAKERFRLKSRAASGVGDVWRITQDSGNPHPAPFPLGVPATAIETTDPTLVLDPFCGSGTTLRAAKDAGVKSIGIEMSERYCEIIAQRCSQEVLDFGGIA